MKYFCWKLFQETGKIIFDMNPGASELLVLGYKLFALRCCAIQNKMYMVVHKYVRYYFGIGPQMTYRQTINTGNVITFVFEHPWKRSSIGTNMKISRKTEIFIVDAFRINVFRINVFRINVFRINVCRIPTPHILSFF